MSMQSLGYMIFSIIADYLDIFKIFLGVTVSPIQNVCAEFENNHLYDLFVVLFAHLRGLVEKYLLFFSLLIANNSSARH